MDANTKKKAKQIGFIMMVSFLGLAVLNTVAKRVPLVAKAQGLIANGL